MGRTHPGGLSKAAVVDRYFLESRNRLLELAAFLDRLDAAPGPAVDGDPRVRGLRRGLERLLGGAGRTIDVQLALSDLDLALRERADRKSATGVPGAPREALP